MRVHQLVAAACFIASMASACLATDGVEGTTVRPKQEDAKVTGCKIAAPDSYDVAVGDLIELDYTYPVVPGAIPKKANAKTTSGAVVKSSLEFREVATPKLVGTGTIAFYFDAKKEGNDTVTLVIDGVEYEYKFKVAKK